MTLLERITTEVKEALKAGNSDRVGTLRFLTAQLHNREIEKRSAFAKASAGQGQESTTLTDDEVMDVLRKEVKKRREAADLFRQGNRADMAEKEEAELKIIQEYLPAAPGEADVRKVVAELKAQGITDFSALMKESMARLKGADGSLVSKVVKATESS